MRNGGRLPGGRPQNYVHMCETESLQSDHPVLPPTARTRNSYSVPGIGTVNQVLKFGGIEVLVPRIDRLEFAPVHRQQFPAKEFQPVAQ
jgi:hypothetical protein